MVKGSQLVQLKAALNSAGLTGQTGSKKRKRGSQSEASEREKKAARLNAIQQKMNPFDVKVTKMKHDIGGRKIKGTKGNPAKSKQAGLDQRNASLLQEHLRRNRVGGIVDKRFGENDPTMTPDDRMLERFIRERRQGHKNDLFNLEDNYQLTHYGQNLAEMDEFDNVGLLSDEDEEESIGKIGAATVKKAHFGGFGDDESDEPEEPERRKSKAEAMAEVIAKSKHHKMERQFLKKQDEDTRHELDAEFDSLRSLLYAPDPSSSGTNAIPLGETSRSIGKSADVEDDDYDRHVKELVFDRKAKPKDRTKTEEEIAVEAKIALEKEERNRLRRMRGEEDEDSDGENPRRKSRQVPAADDLDDDFEQDDGDLLGLGQGLENRVDSSESGTDSMSGTDDDDDSASGSNSDEEVDSEAESDRLADELVTQTNRKRRKISGSTKELPFTFPCPSSHEEFLDIVDGLSASDVSTVIQRIRTLFHPSLGPDHHSKLAGLATILLDHALYITSTLKPQVDDLTSLLPQIIALCKAYPVQSAQHVVNKLAILHKNLKRGLAQGASSSVAKTWPGLPELTLLRTIGAIWPTSDMNHAVITPARLLMGAYLGLARIRTTRDIGSGLYLCTLVCQYESLSGRISPEAIDFLVIAILRLCPHKFRDASSLPGSFPAHDVESTALQVRPTKNYSPKQANLPTLMGEGDREPQASLDLLALALTLLGRFADLYKSLEGFIELYQPIAETLHGLKLSALPPSLQALHNTILQQIERLIKFAQQSRRRLTLQAHKPIPIPTFIPKFDTSSSNYLKRQDPDAEKNAASKLQYQFKQERKGALRELRKDSKFMAVVQQKEQREKDSSYKDRMNKVYASMQTERAEQKTMEREKEREKRRAKRK